ncbi:MAG: calcium/proton exchanger [Planctomycetota bacterium]|nr:calcium/proton exchanger [Planctomycetota bacterium]MDA1211381.1 calcium/proton exchanger [Planctomycetota bacterium]
MDFLRKVGWLNLLLVLIPIAVVVDFQEGPALWIFIISASAIIPLAGLMGKSTEMLSEKMGPAIGGLLNASFGNAAELIIAFFALKEGLVDVVKASITGSILGNVLLVLGASFFAGGLKFQRQKFNATAAGMAATLLALAAIGLLVPAIFHAHLFVHHHEDVALERELSVEISIVLFVSYLLMLLFSLKTHKHLYHSTDEQPDEQHVQFSDLQGHWSTRTSMIVLISATCGVAWMSELLVGAIEQASEQMGWSEMFVGVVVVAIVGNAAEHSTAILVAMKNHMELSFQIAVGSGLQIALFVAPVLVFISQLPGFPPLDLRFSMLEVLAVGVSVLVVGLVAVDGESNWMEGLLLLAVYVILAMAFYNLPIEEEHGTTSIICIERAMSYLA